MARAGKLFTIGYEQTPADAVLDQLKRAGVKLLVDVRAVASSRRPGFSKNQLAAGLDGRGIAYVHLRGLGTPKEGRVAARSGKFDALHKIYAKHLRTPQAKEELDELFGAGQEIGAGLHSLLRTRPPAMPSTVDRRDHRRSRWRQGREFGSAAGVNLRPPAFTRNLSTLSYSGLSGQAERAFHHLHASAADMRGNDRALFLPNPRQ